MSSKTLARRLGLRDSVMLGVGSMIGAGIFSVFAPAAGAAATTFGLYAGLGIAALVAYCNASSSAQLAAQYPTSGGTYFFAGQQLGPWPGFMAGWSFIVGKIASVAAMALTAALYMAPAGWEKPIAIAFVLVMAVINYFGITRTALATRIIVATVLTVLFLVVVASWKANSILAMQVPTLGLEGQNWHGILQSASLLFFAFAGYARLATLGEEVKNPQRTIPLAILLALTLTLLVYLLVASSLVHSLGIDQLAQSSAPLAAAAQQSDWPWLVPLVRAAAAVAALGALLALLTGISRTALAMARNHDLPTWFAAIHPHYQIPHRAELVTVAIVCGLVVVTDVREAIAFSSFGVLLYYFLANVSAWTQHRQYRRFHRGWQIVGIVGTAVLVVTLPVNAVLLGIGVVLAGVGFRLISHRRT